MNTILIIGIDTENGIKLYQNLNNKDKEKNYKIYGTYTPQKLQAMPYNYYPLDINNQEQLYEIIQWVMPNELFCFSSDKNIVINVLEKYNLSIIVKEIESEI